ncbi:MAG: hypothetical protein HY897_05250 [Deltaproteobacteria bacterium]|nr:hypothetical protein [Deltaproteobacteria bacterium]
METTLSRVLFGLFLSATIAAASACDVSSVGEDDVGTGGGGGGDTGVPKEDGGKPDAGKEKDTGGTEDTGGAEDTSIYDDVPTPDDAATADGGADAGGEEDVGMADSGGVDAGPQSFVFTGKVTVEGEKPVNPALALMFDQPLGEGVAPVGFAACDPDGNFTIDERCDDQGNCIPIGPGSYWFAAIYDINDDGDFDPDTGDLVGFDPGSPVVVPGGKTTGIDIDVQLVTLMVGSVYVDALPPYIPQAGAYLTDLAAQVRDPADGSLLDDADVSATDGKSPVVFKLVWDAQREAYVLDRQTVPQDTRAVDGEYEFVIMHPAYGSDPVVKKIAHHPFPAAVVIGAPAMNAQFNGPQDISVAWTDPPGAMPFGLEVAETVHDGPVVYKKPADGGQPDPPKSPETVPASVFVAGKGYVIRVFSGKVLFESAGMSMPMAMDMVVIGVN